MICSYTQIANYLRCPRSYSGRSFLWRDGVRWRYLAPSFLYASTPFAKSSSQTCDTLLASASPISSRVFLSSGSIRIPKNIFLAMDEIIASETRI